MAKKGCIGAGCGAVFIIVIAIAAFVVYAVRHAPKPMPEPQKKALSEELKLPAGTALKDGIGVVVLVDTSGSMLENVTDSGGAKAKKLNIAKKVTQSAFDAIADFAAKNPGKNLQAGLTHFDSSVSELLPIGPPDRAAAQQALERMDTGGQTAIGDAMVAGKQQLNRAALKRQFMIVITDGINTQGRMPEDVVAALQALPEEQRPTIYLVAFDVAAKVFEPLVKQGVTVSEAQDAKSLQSALDYILYEKILVEQE